MQISGMTIEDKNLAIQATQLLVDTLRQRVADFPNVKDPAKKILLAKLDDARAGVKYPAIVGLGLLGGSKAPADVLAALFKQLDSSDEVIVSVTAQSLGMLGDKSAVKPLMEKFASLQENVDSTFDKDEAAPAAGAVVPSDQPLNQARLSIAVAVDGLAELKRGFRGATLKEDVLSKYEELTSWWEANKDKPAYAPKP